METTNSIENIQDPKVIYNFDVLKLLYEQTCNDWRHYDSHVWQIPSLSLAINIYLVGQAFSQDLLKELSVPTIVSFFPLLINQYRLLRSLIVFSAGIFTFVLLIALVKHRLHQRGRDHNISKLEELINYKNEKFDFAKPEVLAKIEPDADIIIKKLAPLKANVYLMRVMAITIIIDIIVLFGIFFGGW